MATHQAAPDSQKIQSLLAANWDCCLQAFRTRYRLSRRKQLVEEYFNTVSDEPDWTPRYNIAPTQPVPVIGGLRITSRLLNPTTTRCQDGWSRLACARLHDRPSPPD